MVVTTYKMGTNTDFTFLLVSFCVRRTGCLKSIDSEVFDIAYCDGLLNVAILHKYAVIS